MIATSMFWEEIEIEMEMKSRKDIVYIRSYLINLFQNIIHSIFMLYFTHYIQ